MPRNFWYDNCGKAKNGETLIMPTTATGNLHQILPHSHPPSGQELLLKMDCIQLEAQQLCGLFTT